MTPTALTSAVLAWALTLAQILLVLAWHDSHGALTVERFARALVER